MIAAWRIDKASRSRRESFSGYGAAIAGGRWNRPGTRMVCAAETLSLAIVEKFLHMGDEGRELKLVSFQIHIPADVAVEELKRNDLLRDWSAVPAPASTMDLGTRWIQRARTAVFKVPSIVAESEHNYLLNPLHSDFKRLKIAPAEPFRFDARMWKR